MKKILVPTDFSACADIAWETAIQLSKQLDAELHLFHAASLPDNWIDLPVEQGIKKTVNERIASVARDKLDERKALAEQKGINVLTHFSEGEFLKSIVEFVDQVSIDLVIMGSHGVSGKREWFIGSNTQKVVRKINKTVLVVKDRIPEDNFKNVVFVSGLNENEKEVFQSFIEFISAFDINRVHLLAVNLSGFFNQPTILMNEVLEDFKALAKGYECQTHFYPDYSIEAGIRHFTEDYNVDLIGISNKAKHPIKRIFLGSNVEMIVNHSKVPVLSLDD